MARILTMIATGIVALSLIYLLTAFTQSPLLQQHMSSSAFAQTVLTNNYNENTISYTTTSTTNTNTTSNLPSLVHPDVDTSPIVAVIMIGEDMQGNVNYMPNNVSIGVGEEILIINNSTGSQSMTNGMGPDDPLAGTLFDTCLIPPRGFAEYVVVSNPSRELCFLL
jgi:hypothetical protein